MKISLKTIDRILKNVFTWENVFRLIAVLFVFKIWVEVYVDHMFYETFLQGQASLHYLVHEVLLPSLQDVLIWLWVMYMVYRGHQVVSLILLYLAYTDYVDYIHPNLFGDSQIMDGNYGIFKIWFVFDIFLVVLVAVNTVLYLRYLWEIRPKI